ncbi:hypothetical protein ONA00_01655 [Mycoplasmopsis cynos]|uniref:hypothetical protein n=1 Tax=Mycoplasmopsis cynos TaxID=171284 RepID=UPI0024CB7D1C|nr:hypothetical protein [Mycoplasmopsis cynos]WAM11185.1 hypothetical protein ONA00_01655 [Mycoplasmopsis cynos]
MVPNGSGSRGNYGDFLENEKIYKDYEVNKMHIDNLPAASKQLLGGMFAIWGDQLLDVKSNRVKWIWPIWKIQRCCSLLCY